MVINRLVLCACLGFALLSASAPQASAGHAQIERWLRANIPSGIAGATDMRQCRALQARWISVRQQISAAHQKCLDVHRGGHADGRDCTYAACQDLHTLMHSDKLRAMESRTIRSCETSVHQYQERMKWQKQRARQSRTVSTLGRSQPYDSSNGFKLGPWKNEFRPLPPQLNISEAEKADLDGMIAHWKNMSAVQQAELREMTHVSDEEFDQIIGNANPIDGRDPLAITLVIVQNLNVWMKNRFSHVTEQERQNMCRIWFPVGINKPSSCR